MSVWAKNLLNLLIFKVISPYKIYAQRNKNNTLKQKQNLIVHESIFINVEKNVEGHTQSWIKPITNHNAQVFTAITKNATFLLHQMLNKRELFMF